MHTISRFFFPMLICTFMLSTTAFTLTLQAQDKATISGKAEGIESGNVKIIFDPTNIQQEVEGELVPIKEEAFKHSLAITKNEVIDFVYKGAQIALYLEPGDDLQINFSPDSLAGTVQFESKGKAAKHNQFLQALHNQYPDNYNKEKVAAKMKSENVDALEMWLFTNNREQKKFFQEHADYAGFSEDFKQYVKYTIRYNYYNYLISYPIVRANASNKITMVQRLPSLIADEMTQELTSEPKAMVAEQYRSFLIHYITYFTSKNNDFNKFTSHDTSLDMKQITAREQLKGESYAFVMGHFLNKYAAKVKPDMAKRLYNLLEKGDKKGDYAKVVLANHQEWMNTEVVAEAETGGKGGKKSNSAGPVLTDLDGNEFGFDDLKGKVVYIDFWASWCGPCRKQFPHAKELKKKLSKKQKKKVVFLYISIDDKEENWKGAIEKYELEGKHGLSPGGWSSEVTRYFQINSIPRYMLMDKKGNIVEQSAKRPSDPSVLDDIIRLTKKK